MTESRNGRRMRGNGRKSGDGRRATSFPGTFPWLGGGASLGTRLGRRGSFHIYACYAGYVIFAFLLASCAGFILYIIKKEEDKSLNITEY